MYNQKVGLDHVGFAGSTLETMRAEWRGLGFAPTEPEELRRVAGDGAASSLGQRSCHVVFERGYIELTEVATSAAQHHLAPWLKRGAGLHILAFGVDDLSAWREMAMGSGERSAHRLSPVMSAVRRIAYGVQHGEAGFRWCMREPAETPWALECVVQHLNPELVHQAAVQQHPNGAQALTAVTLQCVDPVATGAVHRTLYGLAPEVLHHVAAPVAGCTALEVALADLAAWRRQYAPRVAGVSFVDGTVQVALASAPGCTLRLVQA